MTLNLTSQAAVGATPKVIDLAAVGTSFPCSLPPHPTISLHPIPPAVAAALLRILKDRQILSGHDNARFEYNHGFCK
ncbi:hypothetical protein E2C01_036556 [Portunus trituberculatus]|uniref:Uncharacterized protein n=1 Tax=Portunus trituberculatus TaxID=210409 RepID=A0A5B7FEM9_PORTR|nr:hypothetical protein [Portunus trituberculatus]